MSDILYYVHDPMCSWCWGFDPALNDLLQRLPEGLAAQRLLGGLAPDTDEPMPEAQREQIQRTWRRVQQRIPGTEFDFSFWIRCTPRRSTWPACRAVIAARTQYPAFDQAMTTAIQRAYYLEARNPSDRGTLIALSEEIGADADRFAQDLDSPKTRDALNEEIRRAREMGVDSFPALVLVCGTSRRRIPVDYRDPDAMIKTVSLIR